jgi:TrmH family RNA methyltransferase
MGRGKHSPSLRFTNRMPQGRTLDLEGIRSLLDRKDREKSGLFWAEGCRSFHCATETGRHIECVVHSPSLLKSRQTFLALRHFQRNNTPTLEVSADDFVSLSTHPEPQGVGVVVSQNWQPLIQVDPSPKDVWIVLDNVRTPGNLGTILRTSAAVGAQGVMLIGGETDPHDSACIRASMGAIFHQRLVRTSAKALVGWRTRHPCRVIGTSPDARLHYRQANYSGALLILMGNERTGIRERQQCLCDTVVQLPMTDRVDSLNLAVATGVLLYEAFGQRDG